MVHVEQHHGTKRDDPEACTGDLAVTVQEENGDLFREYYDEDKVGDGS